MIYGVPGAKYSRKQEREARRTEHEGALPKFTLLENPSHLEIVRMQAEKQKAGGLNKIKVMQKRKEK